MSVTQPYVELTPGPLKIGAGVRDRLTAPRSMEEAVTQGFLAYRAYVQDEVKKQLPHVDMNPMMLNALLNQLWKTFLPRFGGVTIPYIAAQYATAFAQARTGNVPPAMLNSLAQEYAERMGEYFNETSRESLIQGFNTFVNRKVPSRLAAERALEAYGITPRQMGGYTSAQLWDGKVSSAAAQLSAKQKVKSYIAKSLQERFGLFADQEKHNLSMQAQQVAWNYLVEQDRIPRQAEKVWITAKDERVCPSCGPMHGQRVPVLEKFENGLYVPGVHVNCRCEVRLTVVPIEKRVEIRKDERWWETDEARSSDGRFSTSRQAKPVAEKERETTDFSWLDTPSTPQKKRPSLASEKKTPSLSREKKQVTLPVEETVEVPAPEKKQVSLDTPQTTKKTPSLAGEMKQKKQVSLSSDGKQKKQVSLAPPASKEMERVAPTPSDYVGMLRLPQPMYTVLDPDLGHSFSSEIQVTHGMPFVTSRMEAMRIADQERARRIADVFNTATSYGRLSPTFTIHDHDNARWLHGEVEPEEFLEILNAFGSYHAGAATDTFIEIDLYDSDGEHHGTHPMSLMEIGESLGLEPEEFDFAVARVRVTHDHPTRGMTDYTPASREDREEMSTSGSYEILNEAELDDSAPGSLSSIPIYDIFPYDPFTGND